MKCSKRRILPVLLVLMLILGFSMPVQAATYPTAKKLNSVKTVKRGKKAKFVFRLKSGSYTKRNGLWRSEFDFRVYNSDNEMVAWNGADGLWYSGTQKHTVKWKVPSSLKKGKYWVNYRTYFNKSDYGYRWFYRRNHTTDAWFTIRVK